MGSSFQSMRVNAGKIRRERVNGREYLVSPTSMIVPGVLTGSQGALLYTEEELAKDPQAWNGVPIVLRHPVRNGVHVSARDPEILREQGLGYVYRASVDGKLGSESWFDEQLVKERAPKQYAALVRGEPVELSTGLFTDNEPAPPGATYNGQPYDAVARNYRPDHLALLPDEKGACSREDGCGFNVNEAPAANCGDKSPEWYAAANAALEQHYAALNCGGEGGTPGPCPEGGGDKAGKQFDEDRSYKAPLTDRVADWAIDNGIGGDKALLIGGALLAGTTLAAVSKQDRDRNQGAEGARPKSDPSDPKPTGNHQGDIFMAKMTRPQAVTFLAANCDCWKGDKAKALEGLDDDQIQNLVGNARVVLVVNSAKPAAPRGPHAPLFNRLSKRHQKAARAVWAVRNARNQEEGEGEPAGVDIAGLAEFLGIAADPASDPVGFVNELKAKLDEISAKLGIAAEPPAPEPPAAMQDVPPDEEEMPMNQEEEEEEILNEDMGEAAKPDEPIVQRRGRRRPALNARQMEVFNYGLREIGRHRRRMIDALVANVEDDDRHRRFLEAKPTAELELLFGLIPQDLVEEPAPNYAGMAGGVFNSFGGGRDEEPEALDFDEARKGYDPFLTRNKAR